MRTTLTIDDDVAAEIETLRREKEASLKDIVNDALRRGLADMRAPRKRTPFRTQAIDAGAALMPNLDNTAEIIAMLEGEDHK
jgi:hypothetical protein